MRSLFILLSTSLLLTFIACSNSSSNVSLTDEQMLTSHTWVSYHIIYGPGDTTNNNSFSFTFDPNGTFTATGYTFSNGSSSGTWSLVNGELTLGNVDDWEVLLLTNNKLHILKIPTDLEMHLH